MRNWVFLSAGAIALVTASCAQPEPQVLSEAPRSASSAQLTSPSETTDRESQPGRFIARCATEADGGAPGMTIFTDGTQNVTDHCLSRYFIGIQPAPGALYVPDTEAGTFAPQRETQTQSPGYEWTPAQPRTDAGPDSPTGVETDRESADEDQTTNEGGPTNGQPGEGQSDEQTSGGAETPVTTPENTTPSTPPTTTPGQTDPTEPTETRDPRPTVNPETGESDTPPPGSTEPSAPTTVPTVTEAPRPQPGTPPTSVTATNPSGPFGSTGSEGSAASGERFVPQQSSRLPRLWWPSQAVPPS